jgi:hypothetical protein
MGLPLLLNPAWTLPQKFNAKRTRNESCLSTERSEGEFFRFPFCIEFWRVPVAQRRAASSRFAFLWLLSLAKQRK